MKELAKKYLPNIKQAGEALELLTSLPAQSVDLVILDPQYRDFANSSRSLSKKKQFNFKSQADYEIVNLLIEIERILKPNAFCLLWVNKTFLLNQKLLTWFLKLPLLKLVDFLTWEKNNIGFGHYFRNKAEYAYFIQKDPYALNCFKSHSLPSIWKEKLVNHLHPHQKPHDLIKALIAATTNEGDLVVDPCAGSFIVLEACQVTNRNFLGVDLNFNPEQRAISTAAEQISIEKCQLEIYD